MTDNDRPTANVARYVHRILLTVERPNPYGILFRSVLVYRTSAGSYPTRVVVWSNVNRPNPHPGERKWTAYGTIGGNGQYLDPANQGTDDKLSVLLDPECIVISAHGDGTGTAASGQVFSRETLRNGDILELVYPDGTSDFYEAKFTNNGHGIGIPVV